MVADSLSAKRDAIRFATIDSTIALMLALSVNASILILAAATFHRAGEHSVADLGEAQKLLTPLLGSSAAADGDFGRASALPGVLLAIGSPGQHVAGALALDSTECQPSPRRRPVAPSPPAATPR